MKERTKHSAPWSTAVLILLTLGIACVLSALRPESPLAFLEETQSPSTQTYYAILERFSLTRARPWMLLSAWLLHGSWAHWGFNAVQLAVYGAAYERARGPARLLLVFFVGHVLGSTSYLVFGPNRPALGMSAATWALAGAIAADTLWVRGKALIPRALLVVLAFVAWVALGAGTFGGSAHIAGLVGGFFCALVLAFGDANPGAGAAGQRPPHHGRQ